MAGIELSDLELEVVVIELLRRSLARLCVKQRNGFLNCQQRKRVRCGPPEARCQKSG